MSDLCNIKSFEDFDIELVKNDQRCKIIGEEIKGAKAIQDRHLRVDHK